MEKKMFDFVIGNPPYHEEQESADIAGSKKNYSPPVYNLFMDAVYQIAEKTVLIHPARFLFNAGSTPKAWNAKMLEDKHFKVLDYDSDSKKYFPNLSTPIKGGVAITYRDSSSVFGAIQAFSPFPEMNGVVHKVTSHGNYSTFMEIIYPRTSYRLTKELHLDYPDALSKLSEGHAYDMASNIFERLPEVFYDKKPNDEHKYIRIHGRSKGKRLHMYIRRRYVNTVDNLRHYKVFVPQANGDGTFGEVLSRPIIGKPYEGSTETFISIGKFESKDEAFAVVKYISTKFTRSLLNVLKVTQSANKAFWKLIPLQDFTSSSDIDWAKSISEIDRQLYKKYGLSEEEIAFIETRVKEME